MKTAIKTSLILSWFNLVVACFFVFIGLIAAITMGPQLGLVAVVLFGAIGLHSYESLRLRKCVIYNTPMDKKTPLSLQVMGFISMFFSFVTVTNGFVLFRHAKETVQEVQKNYPEQFKQFGNANMEAIYQGAAGIMIVFGLAVLINVLMSMSLLRWYRNQNQEQ
jgi:hypothetical protein